MTDSEETPAQLQARVTKEATRADVDTEVRLARLAELAEIRREKPDIKTEYEVLRDELAAQIEAEGSRIFIGPDGEKYVAYVVSPEPIEVDVAELEAMDETGKIPVGLIDKVAPRKVDKEAFRRAVAKEEITKPQFLRVAKTTKGTAFVKFLPIDPDD